MKPPIPSSPFSCRFTPNFPEILYRLGCSLVVSTFQAGKLVFISPKNEEELIQLPRTFIKAMGIAVEGNKMAVATKDEVVLLKNSPELAIAYPTKPNVYDSIWLPRATYYTGQVDVHDLHFGTAGLWAVNTSFSCLCTIDAEYSFIPKWKPSFISELVSEDRCHLNGLAMQNGEPIFATALGTGNEFQSWRNNITKGGAVFHVPSGEIIARDLAMPHSPRIYENELFLLLSAKEELICLDINTGKYETIAKIPGFVRGMAQVEDYVFITTSRLRKNSTTFKELSLSKSADVAGITVVHLPSGAIVAQFTYLTTVDEIYDIQILPQTLRPNILNTYEGKQHEALHLPEATYWAIDQTQVNN
jgi:uncharacterized protein (TIGR03032 family)